jgi:hypothetical protein
MKKSRFTDVSIKFTLKQSELGLSLEEACRNIGVRYVTFYKWKHKYAVQMSAGSVVVKSVLDNVIVAGYPAILLKEMALRRSNSNDN